MPIATRSLDAISKTSESPVSQEVQNRGVHAVHNQLRQKAHEQHQADDRGQRQPLAAVQVRESSPPFRHRTPKDLLNYRQNHRRRYQQTQNRHGSRDPRQRENAAENKKLAHKPVQPRQPERREERNPRSEEHTSE